MIPSLEGTYRVQETGTPLKDSYPGEEGQEQQPHARQQEAEGQREHPAAHQRPVLPVAAQQEPRRHARRRPRRLHEGGDRMTRAHKLTLV